MRLHHLVCEDSCVCWFVVYASRVHRVMKQTKRLHCKNSVVILSWSHIDQIQTFQPAFAPNWVALSSKHCANIYLFISRLFIPFLLFIIVYIFIIWLLFSFNFCCFYPFYRSRFIAFSLAFALLLVLILCVFGLLVLPSAWLFGVFLSILLLLRRSKRFVNFLKVLYKFFYCY